MCFESLICSTITSRAGEVAIVLSSLPSFLPFCLHCCQPRPAPPTLFFAAFFSQTPCTLHTRGLNTQVLLAISPSLYLSIFKPIYLPFYLFVCLSIYPSIYLPFYLSIDLSLSLSNYLVVNLSSYLLYLSIEPSYLSFYRSLSLYFNLSICLSISLSMCPSSIYLSVCLSVYLFGRLCVCLPISLSINPSIHLSTCFFI